ncbi:hypothetical protein KIKIMORA_01230 [Brevundimonas phage vB_BpoS-Kikimora]|uniref:Uncharacterized protein n=1 Tax=Brevundimonas phage vB_BpoS-Kikimora TaxID=2948601 RepID=A0A9E7MRT7_9CAUD|nr:hypothetical protein KIKIMORA_01230 [Brevundimonas phage vB_BpoS-Kikimora]
MTDYKCRVCRDLGKISLGYGAVDNCPACADGSRQLYLEPELEQDEGDVTLRAFTPDGQSCITYTIHDRYTLTHRRGEAIERLSHQSFIQSEGRPPRIELDRVHPVLKNMARAICLSSGRPDDAVWTIQNDGGDQTWPSWAFYLDHARQALQMLTGLDDATLMRGTAGINWDTLPPDDDLGDPDYAPDFDRMLKALVHHLCKPLKKEDRHD